jgi:hypothetical protein
MTRHIELLTLLLENSEIITFEYWSEFILGIQRDEHWRHPTLQEMFGKLRIPSLFRLRLRGKWRIGELQEWELAAQCFPTKGISPIPVESPFQASLIMTKLGRKVSTVSVSERSDLTLNLSDGSPIVVQGIGGRWDESWFLELPADDPDRDQWSIICDSQGLIGGKFPTRINA